MSTKKLPSSFYRALKRDTMHFLENNDSEFSRNDNFQIKKGPHESFNPNFINYPSVSKEIKEISDTACQIMHNCSEEPMRVIFNESSESESEAELVLEDLDDSFTENFQSEHKVGHDGKISCLQLLLSPSTLWE